MQDLISLDRLCSSVPVRERIVLAAGQVLVALAAEDDGQIDGRPLPAGWTAVAAGPLTLRVQGCSLQLAVLSKVPGQEPGIAMAPAGFANRTSIFFQGLQNAGKIRKEPDGYMISSVILQFLSHWHRRDITGNKVASQAGRWLEAHCREHVTAQDLADALGYSRWYVMHCFSDVFSMSVHTYLMYCRLAGVKKAILEGTRSMEEIALDNGFSSRSAMHRTFVRLYGITPGEYRRFTERNDRNEETDDGGRGPDPDHAGRMQRRQSCSSGQGEQYGSRD
ncbi:helix-turn-helix transcriptional regulator [uncultured Faecalibaculum sp.]|uniref:helix-turn-helix transcriptional regulator n=1 Tax=uncultured Faecalibaculum sp. TaxID=1729681 RepID=UPI002615CE0E|nr:helix-turn-helix transcriptional regulator [uncultured Faecalibaculum sp.]